MEPRSWARWAPLTGVVAPILMLVAFLIAGSSPDTNDDAAKINTYLTSHSNQVKSIVAFFVFLVGVMFLIGFFAALRSRLVSAEGGLGRIGHLVFGAGVASAAVWVAAVTFFTAPLFAVNDTSKLQNASDFYRFSQDAGYQFWVAAAVIGAIVVWGTSAVALRSGVLPRWYAWLGMLIGVICLLAVFFIPAFVYWAWLLITGVLLAWRTPKPFA